MSAGYTYAMVSVEPGEPTSVRVSFHLDELAYIRLSGAGTSNAHLYISHGDTSVTVAPLDKTVTELDVQLARTLADQAAAYAAEVERLHAEQSTQATDAA